MGCAVFGWVEVLCKYDVNVGYFRLVIFFFRRWQINGQMDDFLTLPHVCLRYFESFYETGGTTKTIDTFSDTTVADGTKYAAKIRDVKRFELLAKMESIEVSHGT